MLREVEAKALKENVFSLLDDQWTLITAGTKEDCNTMTASWGGLGVLWHKNVATIYVRPQRHTFEYLEREEMFSLSFFDESYREQLVHCGTVSGRDTDKFRNCGFTVEMGENTPYIGQARLVLICKKRYWNDLDPANMDADALSCYDGDYHRMYIGEIVKVLVEE